MSKQSYRIHKNVFLWLFLPLTIGLSGSLLLRRKKTNKTAFNRIDSTKFKNLKKYIIAQSKVESANYSSPLFLRANNAFGMKNALYRTQLGEKVYSDPYRYYENLEESIDDFLLYLDFVDFPLKVENTTDYAFNLKKLGYYESDPNDYVRALNSWL